jgi:hypothetical protein
LEEGIELPIGEAFEDVVESGSDPKGVETQIYDELQISIGSDRQTYGMAQPANKISRRVKTLIE